MSEGRRNSSSKQAGHGREKALRTSKRAKSFYKEALSQAEQVLLPEALEVEGLEQEIALLRLKLQQTLVERPEDMDLLLKGVNLLVRAVAAQYRLSPKAKEELMDSVIGVLEGVGEALGLPKDVA